MKEFFNYCAEYHTNEDSRTYLEIVNHIINRHPNLATSIEQMAIHAQGKSINDIHNFNEWKFGQGYDMEGIFSRIYSEKVWGQVKQNNHKYCSGTGSHDELIVTSYVNAINNFVNQLGVDVSVVDLGCGDFNVGSKIRPVFANYIACDIVSSLISFNKIFYHDLDVDFRQFDLTRDEIPTADVIIVRQVLQHLSNKDIINFITNVVGKCKYLIVTEHLPATDNFTSNIDKPAGPNIRLGIGSGIVLTDNPFNLVVDDKKELCVIPQYGGKIVTTVYTMPSL